MLSTYLSLNERLERMGRDEFTTAFPELARVLPHLGTSLASGAAQIHELYARHARQVAGVIEDAIRTHAPQMRRRELPPTCLLCLVCAEPNGTAHVAPPELSPLVGNRFERNGDYWAVRFGNGEQNLYKADRGFAYLRVLLDHPNREFTPSQLEARVLGARATKARETVTEAVAAGVLGTGAATEDDAVDAEAVDACRVRLKEIEHDLEELRASQEPSAPLFTQELTTERDGIAKYLLRATGLRGHSRKIGEVEEEKVRKRVCAALTRARQHIRKYDPSLADHFKSPRLILGNRILYAPPDATVWPA